MHDDIDDLIRASAPTDEAFPEMSEAAVWRRVGEHHRRAVSTRLQVGVLVLAVLIGAVGGGVYSSTDRSGASELRVLTVEAGLEPFNLASDIG